MGKKILIFGGVLLLIALVLTLPGNLNTMNWGTSGGINDFFSGLIFNIVELLVLVIAIYIISRKSIKSQPSKEFTPIIEDG